MIIYGWTSLTFTKDKGEFFCPRCFADTPYHLKSIRRFFTLYFIPVIPLDQVGQYVICRTCRQRFDPVVLQMTAADYQEVGEGEFHDELHRAMALMMVAGDSGTDEAVAAARDLYAEVSGEEISSEDVYQEITAARESGQDLPGFLESHRDEWSDDGKDMIVRALFLVASASGSLHAEQQQLLQRIPDSLQISEDRFRQIVQNAIEE